MWYRSDKFFCLFISYIIQAIYCYFIYFFFIEINTLRYSGYLVKKYTGRKVCRKIWKAMLVRITKLLGYNWIQIKFTYRALVASSILKFVIVYCSDRIKFIILSFWSCTSNFLLNSLPQCVRYLTSFFYFQLVFYSIQFHLTKIANNFIHYLPLFISLGKLTYSVAVITYSTNVS